MPSSQCCPSHPVRRFILPALCALTVLGLVGCEDAEIKKYTQAREKAVPDLTRLAGYELPKGWTRAKQTTNLVVAAFDAGEGKEKVSITISRFQDNGGLVMNINRWRKQVGLADADDKIIKDDLRYLRVDGVEKTPYADLTNPKKSDSPRILGVIAERGPLTWFFKMTGPPAEVEKHKAAFEKFVESVRFGGTGVNDG